MMPTVNEDILDRSISHSVGLQRYSSAVVRKIITILNKVDGDLVAQIMRYDPTEVSGSFSRNRLEKMLEAVRAISADAYRSLQRELNGELRDLAAYEADFQRRIITGALPVELDIVQPSAAQLYAAVQARPFQGAILKDWYRGMEANAQRRIEGAIQMGFVEGESIDKIVRRVRGTRAQQYKDGILEINRRGAEAVVRTAVNHTATVARNETYKANESVIGKWQFVATLDSRTTLTCASLDGERFDLGKGPLPPRHFGCRSTTVPVVKSWKELGINLKEAPEGTRSSLDGQVAASITYGEWLRKQPKHVQEDVLGVKKAKLFKDGNLKIDRFVDNKGEELTLDELRAKEASAFDRAGL